MVCGPTLYQHSDDNLALSKSWCGVHSCGDRNMPEVVTAAVLHQQMPANEIRQTCAVLEAIMPDDGATWGKFGACEEIADVLKRRPYCRARLIRRATTS